MACCGGGGDPEQVKKNGLITKELRKDKDKMDRMEEVKLLLLGPGESGKSTVFKQLVHLYASGFNSNESRRPYTVPIYDNAIESMKKLVEQCELLSPKLENCKLGKGSEDSARFMLALEKGSKVTPEVAKHIKILWGDQAIHNCFDVRALFQLTDTCLYLFDRIDAIAQPDYVPSYEDVLHVRARTTGIAETVFELEKNKFKLLDVGGQKNERKKWIHSFQHVTAVIYVVALSEYDQMLFEDGVTNRMHDALSLFTEISGLKWFMNTPIILFMNKNDLFKKKIEKQDLAVCWPDYTGGCNYDRAIAFLKKKFLSCAAGGDTNEDLLKQQQRKLYIHITCATDTSNVNFTFLAVRDIIIKRTLKEYGLVV